MAFNSQFIAPSNLNSNIGLGVQIPFTSPNVFSSTYNTNEAIKNNLINYFLTNPGEIPLNPSFGAGLRNFLFRQTTENTFSDVEAFVRRKLSQVFPSINISQLNVVQSPTVDNAINIQLTYFVPNSNISGNVTFNFST